MAPLPSPFVACDRVTLQGDPDAQAALPPLNPRFGLDIPKGMRRWNVFTLESSLSTEECFDALWGRLGDRAERHLSVRKDADETLWALIYKGDQAGVTWGEFAEELRLSAAFGVPTPGGGRGGKAASLAIVTFARAWFSTSTEVTSNFEFADDEAGSDASAFENVYADTVQQLSDREFHSACADAKMKRPQARTGSEPLLTRCKAEFSARRAIDRKEAKADADLLRNPCYRRVNVEDKDFLHMPTDFTGVEEWVGETWDPETKCKRSMTYLHYLNSEEHLERTAVIYSDAGSGKTAVVKATAGSFAMRYQDTSTPHYLCAGTAFGFKKSYGKGLVVEGVPRVIEDFKPQRQGNTSANRQPFEEFVVNLLNVKDGGTIDTPGGEQMAFPPSTPQLISTNRKFDQWIEDFKEFPVELQHAVAKRIVFFTVPDTPLVKGELRKRKREDDRSTVEEGLLREREFLRQHGRTDVEGLTISTTASGSGASSPAVFSETASGSGGSITSPSSARVNGEAILDSEGSSESGESEVEEAMSGGDAPRAGPNVCLPELPLLDKFVVTTLVFAADFLTRIGKLERAVFEKYLQELRELSPKMADAYEHTAHCSVSFLTDTTSLKLIQRFLSGSEVTPDALYNVVLGQTVLPSWRKLEALGPFAAENPPTPEDFRARHEQHYPGVKAVVPSHFKQGVLSLLGAGPEIDACGRFANELAGKIPCVLEGLRQGGSVPKAPSVCGLGLPAFRELLVLRLLAVADPRLCDWDRRDLGDYAQLGLWLLDGMEEGAARAAVKAPWGKAADFMFDKLLRALPGAFQARDRDGIIETLEELGLCPLAAQSVEHMLCEFRKLCLPEGRPTSGERYEGYAELWREVAPVLARRAQGM